MYSVYLFTSTKVQILTQKAVHEHPDVEFQKMKEEEEKEAREASRIPRALLMLIAPGFSEMDVSVPVRVLRTALIDVELVSLGVSRHVTGDAGMRMQADVLLAELSNVHEFCGVIVPGGNATFVKCLSRDRRVAII